MGYNSKFLNGSPLNTSFESGALPLTDAGLFSIQIAFTGSACSFQAYLQASSDAYSNAVGYTPPHFDTISGSLQAFSQAGSFTWNVSDVGYTWVQLVIVDKSSGANNGTITASINVKGPL